MTPYLTHEQIREFEDKIGWKKIREANEIIGIYLDFKPEISYAVGDDKGYCYNPSKWEFPNEHSQKSEAERWLNEQITNYPNGWVAKDGYKVIKIERYPHFDQDWNELIEALKRHQKKGFLGLIDCNNIHNTWQLLFDDITAMKQIDKIKS